MGMVNGLYASLAPTPSLAPGVSASRVPTLRDGLDCLTLRDGPPEALPSPPDAFRGAADVQAGPDEPLCTPNGFLSHFRSSNRSANRKVFCGAMPRAAGAISLRPWGTNGHRAAPQFRAD